LDLGIARPLLNLVALEEAGIVQIDAMKNLSLIMKGESDSVHQFIHKALSEKELSKKIFSSVKFHLSFS